MSNRTLIFVYGLMSYALFVGVFGYTILFIGNIGVSRSLDTVADGDLATALLVDLGLLSLFAVQHSVMARLAFKRLWTRIIPPSAERSTYVLASSLALAALVWFWQPLGGIVWQVEDEFAVAVLYAVFVFGWALLFVSTFLINHFDLFGLRQVWMNLVGKRYEPLGFVTPSLYRHVRHPLYVGMLLGLWAAPTMTVAHLVFALLSTAYIAIGARLEERDLEAALPGYAQYRREVPMFIPRLGNRADTDAPASAI